jgi:hypothetical protein
VPNFAHTQKKKKKEKRKKKTGPLPLSFNLKHCSLCFFFVPKLLVKILMEIVTLFWIVLSVL